MSLGKHAAAPAAVGDTMRGACLVIPVYNEARVLRDVLSRALEVFPRVVCVDDGSTDGSADIALRAGALVVRHQANLGQGAALTTGLQRALQDPRNHYIVTFDADGQHRVEDAVAMVLAAQERDMHVVLGSRFLNDTPRSCSFVRGLVLRAGVHFSRATTGLRLTDAHNGLRVIRRDAAGLMRLRLHGMSHASEILSIIARHQLTYCEHPVTVAYTPYSMAKGQRSINSVNIVFDLAVNRLRSHA